MNIVKCKLHWSFAHGQQNIPCIQGIFHKRFFHCNSSSMKITFCCHTSRSEVITMKFCTAVLSWHVQNFVAMWYLTMELHPNKVPSNLNYDGKIIREMGPSSIPHLTMAWLLLLPGHQQSWYRLCEMRMFLSYLRLNLNDLQCFTIKEWCKIYTFSTKKIELVKGK